MTLEYKGYMAGNLELDEETNTLSGIVAGLKDVIHFEGSSVEEVTRAFRDSIDAYLAFCESRGEAPDKPYSGNISLRTDPELHRKAAMRATAERVSISDWLSNLIRAA